MSDLKTVYSPEGDKFEVSNLNARDLVAHCGYTYQGPREAKPESKVADENTKSTENDANTAPDVSDEPSDQSDEDAQIMAQLEAEAAANESTKGKGKTRK